jgi:hypothetical protein
MVRTCSEAFTKTPALPLSQCNCVIFYDEQLQLAVVVAQDNPRVSSNHQNVD